MKKKIVLIAFTVFMGIYLIWFMFKGGKDAEEPNDFEENVVEIEQVNDSVSKEKDKKDVVDNKKDDNKKEKDLTEEKKALEEKFAHIQVPDEIPTKYDFFDAGIVQETMQQAKDFVTIFHSYDHASPKSHIYGIENLVYEEIFNFFIDTKLNYIESVYDVRGIKLRIPKEVIAIEDDIPYPDENIYWNVQVKSEVTKSDGTKEIENKNYNLEFERNSLGKYRIVDFFIYD